MHDHLGRAASKFDHLRLTAFLYNFACPMIVADRLSLTARRQAKCHVWKWRRVNTAGLTGAGTGARRCRPVLGTGAGAGAAQKLLSGEGMLREATSGAISRLERLKQNRERPFMWSYSPPKGETCFEVVDSLKHVATSARSTNTTNQSMSV